LLGAAGPRDFPSNPFPLRALPRRPPTVMHKSARNADGRGHDSHGEPAPVVALTLVVACAAFGLAGAWLDAASHGTLAIAAYVAAYVAGGIKPTLGAIASLRHREITVDLLMLAAAAGAAFVGDWGEGTVLLFLFSFSGALEAYAMYRTTRSIDALIQLRPREASRVKGQNEERVAIEDLHVRDVVRVRPGERFPVDGEVAEGESWADESTITGESEPVEKRPGDDVYAGTFNGRGSLLVQMTRAVADTTLERIVSMVRQAQAEKTPTQQFVESWQQPYVLGVFAAAAFTFVASWLYHSGSANYGWSNSLYHAMVLLVAMSPCAVVAASPAVLLSAIARAGWGGVLFKGGRHMEALGSVSIAAFDKTGTITVGKPRVVDVWASEGVEVNHLLRLAAAVERGSEHHLALTLTREASRRGLEIPPVEDFDSHPGLGVHGRVEGLWVGVGRERLFQSHGVAVPPAAVRRADEARRQGRTALLVVAENHGLAGVVEMADEPRPEAAAAIAALRRQRIEKIVILTGDHEGAAQAAARAVDADEVRSGLLPDEKVRELRRLMENGQGVLMVGDGVNDAPALATATVGIAMGGAGTDVALETADVVLMSDDLKALPFAVWLSRRARARVRQNMYLAFGTIGLLVISSFVGLPLWLGVIGHEGSTLLVVLNGLRILWERPPSRRAPRAGGKREEAVDDRDTALSESSTAR
jgi:Cd2+/Zn2+-exporting ATPase